MSDPVGGKDREMCVDLDAVEAFGDEMMKKMRKNKHKAHWSVVSDEWIISRLKQELAELEQALEKGMSDRLIRQECADVANFAMMISDKHGGGK